MILTFLSSGLFLGWSLGANDAANVFGAAVGTKMLRFKTAAIVCSIFVIIGAVLGGAGTTGTLGKLGSVNAIAGAFIVAFAAAITVFSMIRMKLPVSTSQGIVGAIIGWNFFSGSLTDYDSFTRIVLTWVLCPVLAALISMVFFIIARTILNNIKIHLLQMDRLTRIGLILVGAYGSYSLGANNIANVMGVFVPVVEFRDILFLNLYTFSGAQQLFAIGGLAISAGVFTYSKKVMETIGGNLFKLSPVAAFVVVLAHSIVLFVFSSEGLEHLLTSHGLPAFPLVPVSSSQAIVGAVVGIGLLKGGRLIRYKLLGGIALGWVTTPVLAGLVSFLSLFVFQNVFDQQVYEKSTFILDQNVINYLDREGLRDPKLAELLNKKFEKATGLNASLKNLTRFNEDQINEVITASKQEEFSISAFLLETEVDSNLFSSRQCQALKELEGKTYLYRWQFAEALQKQFNALTEESGTEQNPVDKKPAEEQYEHLYRIFKKTN